MNEYPVLGIMVCQLKNNLFKEKHYYQLLQQLGMKKNLFVYVFYPNFIDWQRREVKGFQYNFKLNKWEVNWFPLPDYVYDRCFYTSSQKYLKYKPYIEQIQVRNILFLGHGLKGKWSVYQILSNNNNFLKHLPKTSPYKNTQQLIKWLKYFPVILKPTGGSHGIGVIKVIHHKNKYEIIGRNFNNKKIHQIFNNQEQFIKWIQSFIKGKRFLIQRFVNLTNSKDQPYDIRVLVQKNQQGDWENIGMAARVGEASNITSNLHGGGKVQSTTDLLTHEFGKEKSKKIINQINELSRLLPPYIESIHGRLFELGLDMGVDRQGKVWIIEVNSKPGRSAFALLGNKKARNKSLNNPILYTQYLSIKKNSSTT